jgi:hypothetical protein
MYDKWDRRVRDNVSRSLPRHLTYPKMSRLLAPTHYGITGKREESNRPRDSSTKIYRGVWSFNDNLDCGHCNGLLLCLEYQLYDDNLAALLSEPKLPVPHPIIMLQDHFSGVWRRQITLQMIILMRVIQILTRWVFASGWPDISMNCISRIVQIGHMRYWWIVFIIVFDSHTETNSE